MARPIRLATRALILHRNRLLLVNAWPDGQSDLWCAPGGGAEPHSALPDNLAREIWEETGLTVAVGAPALINEFHDPGRDFHQVDLYFHCTIVKGIVNGAPDPGWRDPEGVVTERRLFSRDELKSGQFRFKPDSLPAAAWAAPGQGPLYDPLEPLVR